MCVYMRTYLFIYFTILKYGHFNIFIYNLDFYFFTYCFCQLVMIPFYVTNLYPSVTVIEKKKKIYYHVVSGYCVMFLFSRLEL